MYPELLTRRDLEVFLPPIGGLTVYIFGNPAFMSDETKEMTVRVHDECNGSDVLCVFPLLQTTLRFDADDPFAVSVFAAVPTFARADLISSTVSRRLPDVPSEEVSELSSTSERKDEPSERSPSVSRVPPTFPFCHSQWY